MSPQGQNRKFLTCLDPNVSDAIERTHLPRDEIVRRGVDDERPGLIYLATAGEPP